jgi:parvulin-like peptidyl-prolyl isomerase
MTKFRIQNESKMRISNTKTKIVLLFGICALCLFWYLRFVIWISPAFAQDKIIAIVNSDIITQKDLDGFANFMRMQLSREYQGEELEERIQSIKPDLLDKLIEDCLILQEAKKNNINIDENRVKAKINEVRKQYSSDADFKNDLARQGLAQVDLEAKIREQLLIYSIIELKVRDTIFVRPDEVTNFYNKNIKDFSSLEERELLAVTLENGDLARTFAYNLRIGQKLEDLAARYPITVNKLRGSRSGELRKDIEDAVFKLGLEEVSDPILIDGKYYVFKLENIISPRQFTLTEAQDKIYAFLFQEKTQERLAKWLDELKAKSYIKVAQD